MDCNCQLCQRNERLKSIFEKLTEEDVFFLEDFVEKADTDSLDLNCIRSGLDRRYFQKDDLIKFFSLSEEQFSTLCAKKAEEFHKNRDPLDLFL